MVWQFTPHTIALIFTAVVSGVLAVYIWQRRHAPGAVTIVFLMLAASLWSLAYGLQLASKTLAGQVFWAKVEYLGIVVVPIAGLVFAIQFAGWEKWLNRRKIVMLSAVPAVTLLLVWTNEAHELIWNNVRLEAAAGILMKHSSYGPWFWVHFAYSYFLMFVGSSLMIAILINSRDIYRRQAAALLIFAFTPLLGNTIYVSGLSPWPHLDLTPFTFNISGLALAWGLFRYRLADLLPVAYSGIIESVDDAVIVLDPQNRILGSNPAGRRLADRYDAKIVGQPLKESIPELWAQLEASGDESSTSAEVDLDTGASRRIYDARLSPSFDRLGRLACKTIILRDITERKKIEEELRKHKEELEEIVRERTGDLRRANVQLLEQIAEREQMAQELKLSEERYRTLVDQARDIIVTIDLRSGAISSFNGFAEETLGYKRENLLNRTHFLELIHPDDHESINRIIVERAIEERRHPNFPFRLRKADGSYIDVEMNGAIIYDSKNNPYTLLGVIRDVSERKRMEFQLQQSRKLAAIGELSAGVAHEINNPLAIIDIQTGLIRNIVEEQATRLEGATRAEFEECLRTLEDQVRRCQSVTENLLSFTRRSRDEREAANVNKILEKAAQSVLSLSKDEFRIKLILADQLPLILCNSNLLQQVFVNLVTNALKAIEPDGSVTIVSSLDDKENVRVEVKDSGSGISPEIRDRVFEPFFTTRSLGEGSGLGLSTSFYIISQMNGKIDLDSTPGKGTTFTITLPAFASEMDAAGK